MLRIYCLTFAYSALIMAQQGQTDPAFDRIPFDEWVKEGTDAHIKWSLQTFPSRLGVHQRLRVGLSVRIDGNEFVKRRGAGQMVVFIEIRDHDNRVFQTHRAVRFEDLKNPSDLAALSFDQYALIVPGDYQLAAAILDTRSTEHAAKRTKLHVPDLAHDPLPESWHKLPEVEFVTYTDPPDAWYLPGITSRMSLPVTTERPVRVEVVVNESPTELANRRVSRTMSRNMGNVIPALKTLSQIELLNGSLNVTLLDLERRKVSFSQEQVSTLDWTRLRAALVENDPNSIDVHALENHEQNAQFFVSEVRKRLESTESPARVLIVLSGPMAFPKGQDLTPIEATPEPGVRVFYVRYNAPSPTGAAGVEVYRSQMGGGRRAPPSPGMPIPRGGPMEDSLARTLKPLAPKIFDVTTPMEFRNALAAIMSEISRLK